MAKLRKMSMLNCGEDKWVMQSNSSGTASHQYDAWRMTERAIQEGIRETRCCELLQSQNLTLHFAFQLFHYHKAERNKTKVRKVVGVWIWDKSSSFNSVSFSIIVIYLLLQSTH